VVLNSTFHCNNNINDTNECYFRRQNELLGKRKETSDIGGNAVFVFSNSSHGVDLRITDSQFSYGRSGERSILNGGGLSIHVHTYCSNTHNVSVIISNCTFDNNAAHLGANAFIAITSFGVCDMCLYTVHISNCTFSNGHAIVGGGGLYLMKRKGYDNKVSCPAAIPHSWWWWKTTLSLVIDIQICFSHFLDNSGEEKGGGIYAVIHAGPHHFHLLIKTCTFHSNEGEEGAGIYFELLSTRLMELQVTGSEFRENVASLSGGGMFVYVKGVPQFLNKNGKVPVLMTDSYFVDNLAYTGAAVVRSITWHWLVALRVPLLQSSVLVYRLGLCFSILQI